MFGLYVAPFVVEMQFVKVRIFWNCRSSVHVKRNGENAAQREIWIFDIFAINFFIFVQKIRVLEFLDGFMDDFGDPIINSEPSILEYHFL